MAAIAAAAAGWAGSWAGGWVASADQADLPEWAGGMAPGAGESAASAAVAEVTAVLLTHSGDAEGFPRLPLLLASLCRNLAAPALLAVLVIVAPDADLPWLAAGLAPTNGSLWEWGRCVPPWPVRLLADSAVLPTSRGTLVTLAAARDRPEAGGRGASYRLQQLLKLGVAAAAGGVGTPYYLTLDSDLFAAQPVACS